MEVVYMVRGKCFRKWKKNLSGFWHSGLSLAEYCRRNELNVKSAQKWKSRFKTLGYEESVTEERLEIVPLKTTLIGTEPKECSGVHLTLGELHLELDTGFDETTLKRVFQILEVCR